MPFIRAFAVFMPMLLSILCSKQVYAQRIQAGIRTGLGIPYAETKGIQVPHLFVRGTEYINPLFNINAGVFVNVPIIKGFSIQAEGNWQPMGFQHQYADFGVQLKNFNLSYYTVPLMLKYSKWGIGLLGGMQYGSLYKAERSDASGTIHTMTTDLLSDMNKTDWGWVAGVEYTFRFGLGFNFRYYHGMSNIALPRTHTFSTRNAVYNRYAQVWGIHYRFIGNPKRKK